MAFNELAGRIPEAFASWGASSKLFLEWNNLSGALPYAFNTFQFCSFASNELTGCMPEGIPQWLVVSDNRLSGTIGKIQEETRVISASGNQLMGSLPCFPFYLVMLLLARNLLGA